MATNTTNNQASIFDLQLESPTSSCSSSPPTSLKPVHCQNEIDSGCGSDEDPALALKINKGLSMGYDYELIKSVIQQQNDGDDMSKFIETIVRTAEINGNSNGNHSPTSKSSSPTIVNQKNDLDSLSTTSDSTANTTTTTTTTSSSTATTVPHDVYIIDGADLAYSYGNNTFSWRGIEICIKYLHSHGHKKVFVALPYSLKHHRHDQNFSESKSLRDLERKNMLVYTNRMSKQTNKPGSYTHISEMLKFSQKTKGHLITNVSLKDVILDFTVYKHVLEERVIRYRFQNDNFQPLLVTIVNGDDGNDCETHYPLCPYGKKCTYGSKCKYFHIERRYQNPLSITESLQMKARLEKSKLQHQLSNPTMIPVIGYKPTFNHTKSGPEHLRMFNDRHSPVSFYPMMEQSLVDDARTAYEYGLSTTPPSAVVTGTNDFSFVDQRMPISQVQQNRANNHHSWFGTPNQQHSFLNRTFSMPQQQQQQQQQASANNFDSQRLIEEQQQQQMQAAMLIQQQQNWARQQQQMFPMQSPPQPHFEQNVLRLLSMLSLQQQNNMMSTNLNQTQMPSFNPMMTQMNMQTMSTNLQQENQLDRTSVNSQQGLADKIQAVRHLWESENQYSQQLANYNQQTTNPMIDSTLYNQINSTFPQTTQGFVQFQ